MNARFAHSINAHFAHSINAHFAHSTNAHKIQSILLFNQKIVSSRVNIRNLCRFPAITPQRCAESIVDGILRNQLHVIVPAYNRFVIEFFRILPYKVQHLARDILSKENELGAQAKELANNYYK